MQLAVAHLVKKDVFISATSKNPGKDMQHIVCVCRYPRCFKDLGWRSGPVWNGMTLPVLFVSDVVNFIYNCLNCQVLVGTDRNKQKPPPKTIELSQYKNRTKIHIDK